MFHAPEREGGGGGKERGRGRREGGRKRGEKKEGKREGEGKGKGKGGGRGGGTNDDNTILYGLFTRRDIQTLNWCHMAHGVIP